MIALAIFFMEGRPVALWRCTHDPRRPRRSALAVGIAILIVFTIGGGCGGEPKSASTDVAFETIQQGIDGHFNSAYEHDAPTVPRLFRFDDPDSFTAFWRKLLVIQRDGQSSPPVVDFDAETVVAVLDAPKKDYGDTIAVRRIDRWEGRLRVSVAYRVIDSNGCFKGQLLTQPYHIVALAKTNLDIEMELKTELVTCTPDLRNAGS